MHGVYFGNRAWTEKNTAYSDTRYTYAATDYKS